MTANEDCPNWEVLHESINLFEKAIASNDVEKCRELLMELVKGFQPQCEVADLVHDQISQLSTASEN